MPIIVGGSSEAALQRAVRLGDGYVLPVLPLDEMPPLVASVRALLDDCGRDQREVELVARGGKPTAQELATALDLKVGILGVSPWPVNATASHEVRLGSLELRAEDVLANVRAHDQSAQRSAAWVNDPDRH